MEFIVEMLNIRKEFPGVVANDDITLQVKKGEIHALLGENGAGKSTLMSILFGLYHPDAGTIKIRGQEVRMTDPNVANALGIGMVHQHFQLIHNFTVTENIVLGLKGEKADLTKATKRVKELSEQYGLYIEPQAKIEDISVGMQQRVEIMKMLYRDAELLIFDEPTAVLTPQEIQDLMNIMKNLIREGKSLILITHKLKEIKAIADRCTIIRRGKKIDTVTVSQTTEQEMADKMVGRTVSFKVEKGQAEPGEIILELDQLSVRNQKVLGLKGFSLAVRAGEIVGVAGVDGNGQSELVEAISGLARVESGTIRLKGRDITTLPVRERMNAGLAHIPEDRHKHGLVMEFTIEDNLVLKKYNTPPFSKKGILNREAISSHAQQVMEMFDVRAGQGQHSPAHTLSGGNQQKAIVGREIDSNPDLLIAVQPTRGLDVGAIEYIHRRLVEQRNKGKAVLLVSLELDEIMNLSDRIAVVCHGELVDVVDTDKTNENEIGLMMTGIKREKTEETQ
ncbi:MAG: ABC transporter ATP-binding protein [Ruminiclostridium sp.]|nr:ABC transporter ATP-binding protein [Ruminiclostridium sp.]